MRASFFNSLYLLLFVCLLAAPFAHAQTDVEDEYDKIPDEYIEEADNYFDTCRQDYITSQYLNCACMSTTLLRERIARGPTVPQTTILLEINDECFDAINSAGPIYEKCLKNSYSFKPGTDPEKYCECVANTYVEAMNLQKPTIRSTNMVQYNVYANSKCRDPGTALPPG